MYIHVSSYQYIKILFEDMHISLYIYTYKIHFFECENLYILHAFTQMFEFQCP